MEAAETCATGIKRFPIFLCLVSVVSSSPIPKNVSSLVNKVEHIRDFSLVLKLRILIQLNYKNETTTDWNVRLLNAGEFVCG